MTEPRATKSFVPLYVGEGLAIGAYLPIDVFNTTGDDTQMIVNGVSRNRLILGLLYFAISSQVNSFEFPWDLKEYKTYNDCMNVSPKTLQHKEFLDANCTRLFSGNPLSKETKKFMLCTRAQVMKTDSIQSARKEIFSCGSSYPPKKKEMPLNIAAYFFPTPEELSERRAAEAQERATIQRQDMLRQELMRPDSCTLTGGVISCF